MLRRRPVLEPEAQSRRIGLRAPRPWDVHVQLVRVLVVRDVQIGSAVVVDVDELRAQSMAEARRLEPRLDADLAEASVALVEEEQVADPGEIRRESRERARHRLVRIGVPGDEHVRPAVAVDVRDGGARVPPVGVQRALGEGAVAVVPKHVYALRRRDDEIGTTGAVQVGGDAAVALDLQAGVRRGGDVAEPPVHVLEQC